MNRLPSSPIVRSSATLRRVACAVLAAAALAVPAHAAAETDPGARQSPGFTEGQVGLGWGLVDFAGSTAHQRGGSGYGVNHGQSIAIAFLRHPRAVPRLALGAGVRLTLTGASNESGSRYFNPVSANFVAMYGLLSPRKGAFVRAEVGLGSVTRKLRSETPLGAAVVHDFGIGWAAALGLGYRIPLGDTMRLDVLATYERHGIRVERTFASSSQWHYGVSSLALVLGF